MKKINISINEELLERADKYGQQTYISRSGLISLALSQYLSSQEVVSLLRGLNVAMNKIAEQGEVDEETYEKLKDFERVCNAIIGK